MFRLSTSILLLLALSTAPLTAAVASAACGPYDPPEAPIPLWSNPSETGGYWVRLGTSASSSWDRSMRSKFRFNDTWSGMGVTGLNPATGRYPWSRHIFALGFLEGIPDVPRVAGPQFSGEFHRDDRFVSSGFLYVDREVDRFKASCSDEWNAYTRFNHTTVMRPYFRELSVAVRAGTLVHEARHADGCMHNGTGRGGACHGRSCDETWDNGCRFQQRPGANRYKVEWAMSVLRFGDPAILDAPTSFLRTSLRRDANDVLEERFDADPGFRVGAHGEHVRVPTP